MPCLILYCTYWTSQRAGKLKNQTALHEQNVTTIVGYNRCWFSLRLVQYYNLLSLHLRWILEQNIYLYVAKDWCSLLVIVITFLSTVDVSYSYWFLTGDIQKKTVTMASAQSLMGLMSQLQSMENNFTCILMEAALKLASLAGWCMSWCLY